MLWVPHLALHMVGSASGPPVLMSSNVLMAEPSLQPLVEDASPGHCPEIDMDLLSLQGRTLELSRTTLVMTKELRDQVKEAFIGYTQDKSCLKKNKSHDDCNPSDMFKCVNWSIRKLIALRSGNPVNK